MSGKLFDRYGAILEEDVQVLEKCLLHCVRHAQRIGPIRVLEIGMHDGATAMGMEAFLLHHGALVEYIGIDVDDGKSRPRYVPADGHVIIGDSSEVFTQVRDELDLVWVDGCHCINHCILDTVHYSPKVRVGGFICFHDVNPVGSGQEHQYHGPLIPEFGLAVNQALEAIRWPWKGWELFDERIPQGVHNCGTRAFIRTT